jgi:3'-phosphoadenosine 5'-phosphosulfate sulfotransferase (PAPS reductase)/FAD synthetase
MNDAIQSAARILQAAMQRHQPRHVYCLYSGGNDSATSTHLALRLLAPLRRRQALSVAFIDTGTGVPAVRRHVYEWCRKMRAPLRMIDHSQHRGKTYEEWVSENGMPGPTAHSYVYEHLKQRAIEQLRREAKETWTDRVLFVTGVYKGESERRARIYATAEDRRGAAVFVNPCLDWSASEMAAYRRRHDIPQNPVTDVLGKSGECLCGAFASGGELDRIRLVAPGRADWLEQVSAEAPGPWGYEDSGPPRNWTLEKHGQTSLWPLYERDPSTVDEGDPPRLCQGCKI